jgi:hypothetical protein
MLTYLKFNKTFEIHTDESNIHLDTCISQEGKPVAYYSRKLNPSRNQFKITEQELLSLCKL